VRIETLQPDRIARLGMARTFQNLEFFDTLTVIENVIAGTHRHTEAGVLATLARLPRVAARELRARKDAERCLAFVGMSAFGDRRPGELSFGQQRRVEIARALALQPAILLMDEPASGLNDTETEELAGLLLRIRAGGVTILLIEHDMRLVMGIADHVVVMNHGRKIAEGVPQAVRRDPDVVAAYIGTN
jgi:ABC-type branched-subunit amino acid transport system ATPase component